MIERMEKLIKGTLFITLWLFVAFVLMPAIVMLFSNVIFIPFIKFISNQ
jgi:hypothetical protein